MGSSASCSIILAPTNKPFYLAGETVTGHVVFTANGPLTVKSIDMKIVGELTYSESYRKIGSHSIGNTSDSTLRWDFFVKNHPLFIPATNGVSYDDDGYHIQSNTYQWPFSLRLPENLPPSLPKISNRQPYIRYFLEVNMERYGFYRDIRCAQIIRVIPRVPRPRDVWSTQSKGSNFRNLRIIGTLQRNYLLIGEPYITLELNIENPDRTTIQDTVVTLVQRRLLDNSVGRAVIFEQPLPGMIGFRSPHLHHTFQVPVVPSMEFFAPTSSYTRPGDRPEPWTVEYALEVKFKTPFSFYRDIILEFPLVVANSKR